MSPRPSPGYALITAMVFLGLMSLIALAAIRSTGLEVQSSSNAVLRAQAFESAEVSRTVMGALIEPLCATGGWPAAIGGTAPDADFRITMPDDLKIIDRDGLGGPDNWCIEPDSEASFDPATMDIDAHYRRDLRNTLGVRIEGDVAVRRLNTVAIVGTGQAQAAGYGGAGIAVASGGGQIHFHVRSRGAAADTEASASTAATYRYVIRR